LIWSANFSGKDLALTFILVYWVIFLGTCDNVVIK
jgi:hypothetical protein